MFLKGHMFPFFIKTSGRESTVTGMLPTVVILNISMVHKNKQEKNIFDNLKKKKKEVIWHIERKASGRKKQERERKISTEVQCKYNFCSGNDYWVDNHMSMHRSESYSVILLAFLHKPPPAN